MEKSLEQRVEELEKAVNRGGEIVLEMNHMKVDEGVRKVIAVLAQDGLRFCEAITVLEKAKEQLKWMKLPDVPAKN